MTGETNCRTTGLPIAMSLAEVAEVFQISPKRVQQIEDNALRKMRYVIRQDPRLYYELELELP